jgi:hypothetical protein
MPSQWAGAIRIIGIFLFKDCAGSLIDSTWRLDLSIGRVGASPELPPGWEKHTAADGRVFYHCAASKESRWTRPIYSSSTEATISAGSLLGPPLAMFTPGGGRATLPSWLCTDWGRSGEQLSIPLEVDFFGDDYGPMAEEPLKRARARKLFTRTASPLSLDTRTEGAAWGMVPLSSIEALVVFCIDLPEGARPAHAPDLSLPAGSRLYCSTQVWRGSELARLETLLDELRTEQAAELRRPQTASSKAHLSKLAKRIKTLERGLPKAGIDLVEAADSDLGPDGTSVKMCRRGQVSIQRLVAGKVVNPFVNAGRIPNPFEKTVEFGVVGSFELSPLEESTTRPLTGEGLAATDVEVIVEVTS